MELCLLPCTVNLGFIFLVLVQLAAALLVCFFVYLFRGEREREMRMGIVGSFSSFSHGVLRDTDEMRLRVCISRALLRILAHWLAYK